MTAGERGEIAGITAESKPIYFHYIDIKIGGHLYKNIRVGFLKEMGQYAYGVVGQKGFFDIFVVKFDLLKKEMELKSKV